MLLVSLAFLAVMVYLGSQLARPGRRSISTSITRNASTREVAGKDWNDDLSRQSGVRSFLELFGDPHIEALEKRLTDFINVATDLRLHGIPFVGPSSETAEDVMMACKMIVENNAVRIKIDGRLSLRVDVQLILFQEAARRLEAMEASGDSPDAVARGSVFAASARLIRSLHKILWQWNRKLSG